MDSKLKIFLKLKQTQTIFKNGGRIVVFLAVFFNHNNLFAQWYCENVPATGTVSNGSSNALSDSIIIGVSIMIVIFTLIMSVKFLFKPGEKNPDHIKNIVKNEGF